MNIVIIEDEFLTANDLAETLKQVDPGINIIAILKTVEESIKFFETNTDIDLIFSDIMLGKKLSFRIFEKVKNTAPIIFCTAFNEYALEAFDANGIDYLLKPFDKNKISGALEKYRMLKWKFSKVNEINKVLEIIEQKVIQKQSSIIVYVGDKVIPVDINSIAIFYLENEITYAYTFEQVKYVVRDKLDKLEEKHKPLFFRANRQFLINRKAIKNASQYFKRKMKINLTIPFKDQIIVSKIRKPIFISWLSETS